METDSKIKLLEFFKAPDLKDLTISENVLVVPAEKALPIRVSPFFT